MTQMESNRAKSPAAIARDRTDAAEIGSTIAPLSVEQLYRPADLASLAFESTADIEPADGLIGQQRALDAIEFGTRIGEPGFNIFVIGPSGMRMQRALESVLREAAAERRPPSDWVYVNNFKEPDRIGQGS